MKSAIKLQLIYNRSQSVFKVRDEQRWFVTAYVAILEFPGGLPSKF